MSFGKNLNTRKKTCSKKIFYRELKIYKANRNVQRCRHLKGTSRALDTTQGSKCSTYNASYQRRLDIFTIPLSTSSHQLFAIQYHYRYLRKKQKESEQKNRLKKMVDSKIVVKKNRTDWKIYFRFENKLNKLNQNPLKKLSQHEKQYNCIYLVQICCSLCLVFSISNTLAPAISYTHSIRSQLYIEY